MAKKQKKYEDYEKSVPKQLTLFQFLEESDSQSLQSKSQKFSKFSQSIEMYDFVPKYVWGKVARINNVFLPPLEREFEYKGVRRKIIIHPAGIVDKDTKVSKYFYLGRREEIIEEVLRKLAIEGQGVFLDGQAGVAFSIYQIRKELELHNHRMSYTQVLESLKVLALTRLELINPDNKKETIIFSPIENLGLSGEGEETQTYVIFSPLVTNGIKNLKFRLYNYDQVMKYKSVIARQLHKRMAHHYRQASIANKYSIYLTTLIRDFGLAKQKYLRTNLIDVEIALQEMKKNDVILNYQIDRVFEPKRKKIVDMMINIQPSFEFERETKKANHLETKNQKLIETTLAG
jgi:hypothetical protein